MRNTIEGKRSNLISKPIAKGFLVLSSLIFLSGCGAPGGPPDKPGFGCGTRDTCVNFTGQMSRRTNNVFPEGAFWNQASSNLRR